MNTNTANNNKILQTLLEGAFGENNVCLIEKVDPNINPIQPGLYTLLPHNITSLIEQANRHIAADNCDDFVSDFDYLIYIPDLEEKTDIGFKLRRVLDYYKSPDYFFLRKKNWQGVNQQYRYWKVNRLEYRLIIKNYLDM